MADTTITALPTASGIDGAADWIVIDRTSLGATQKINRQTLLGVTGQPMDISSSQNVTNKTLDDTNTVTLKDTLFTLQDDSDTTKQAKFQLSGITTATTRTYTLPNASSTLADISSSQTFTNKTLTSPVITGGSIDNSTVTVDAVSGHTSANSGTIYGIAVAAGKIGNAGLGSGSVNTSQIASGIQLVDKMKNPYKFSVYRNAALNSGNGAFATLIFDTVNYDTGSNYSTSTGTFTVPVTGFYHVEAMLQATTASTGQICIISIFKNGTEVRRGYQFVEPTSSVVIASVVVADLSLTSGDLITIRSFGSGALVLTVGNNPQFTYFDCFMISAT